MSSHRTSTVYFASRLSESRVANASSYVFTGALIAKTRVVQLSQQMSDVGSSGEPPRMGSHLRFDRFAPHDYVLPLMLFSFFFFFILTVNLG